MISVMVEAMKSLTMETSIKATMLGVKPTVKESSNGLTVKSTMVNGVKALKRATASGEASKATPILDSGRRVKLMDTECISGRMGTGMRVSGEHA